MDSEPTSTLEKMRRYCAYQERSHRDVSRKMYDLRITGDEREEITLKLMEENFLNEERFARAYVRGKFNIKNWGRNRIIGGLRQHRIQAKCMNLALEEISTVRQRDCYR